MLLISLILVIALTIITGIHIITSIAGMRDCYESEAEASRIAGKTAENRPEIMAGFNKPNLNKTETTRAPEGQAHSISKSSAGIDQATQAIRQNSAAMVKSAAASDDLSSQAEAIGELLGLFKATDRRSR